VPWARARARRIVLPLVVPLPLLVREAREARAREAQARASRRLRLRPPLRPWILPVLRYVFPRLAPARRVYSTFPRSTLSHISFYACSVFLLLGSSFYGPVHLPGTQRCNDSRSYQGQGRQGRQGRHALNVPLPLGLMLFPPLWWDVL
jgi:hypothetical protein